MSQDHLQSHSKSLTKSQTEKQSKEREEAPLRPIDTGAREVSWTHHQFSQVRLFQEPSPPKSKSEGLLEERADTWLWTR